MIKYAFWQRVPQFPIAILQKAQHDVMIYPYEFTPSGSTSFVSGT